MKEEYKPKIIQVSFKTTDIEDKLLYNWVLEKVRDVGGNKSAYIKRAAGLDHHTAQISVN